MPTTLTHKIKIDPTYKQGAYFRKACGVARFTWNWALAKWEEKYKAGEKPDALSLKKEFNALKPTLCPWVYEVTKYASQQPFIYLQRAFQGFFSKRTKYPKFKKKGIHDSFYIGGDQLQIQGSRVKIPNLGWVRLREQLRFSGKINGATVSRSADHWFISISVEAEQPPTPCESQACVGVDVGIKSLATLSDGRSYPTNAPLKKHLARLKRFQRRLSRCQKDSKNRIKVKRRIARLHYRVACSRNDPLHKLSAELTKNYKNIVIEDLDISAMVKNRKLSRSILDGGWYEFRRQLCYKAQLRGNKIFIANRWYASSKRCCACGHYKKELNLADRIYNCENCGLNIDRDLNAARCLEQLVSTVSSTGIDACGQDGSVIVLKTLLQPAWQKQELSPV